MFTYYTIIGKSPAMIDAHLDNIVNYAGFNKIEDRDLLVIVFRNDNIQPKVTNEIISIIVEKYKGRVWLYEEPHDNFLLNLYECWNLGYKQAKDGLVFRGGSDQIFSKDSFPALVDAYSKLKDNKVILQANTIENMDRSPESRHILARLGDDFSSFSYKKFEELCEKINDGVSKELLTINDALIAWGHPTGLQSSLGNVQRTDGCSWLMTRNDWEMYGPLPPLERGITGDVIIHDRLQQAGYRNFISRDCITYHFVRGESVNV